MHVRIEPATELLVRVDIEPSLSSGERAQRYRVWHEGAVLIEDTWNPEYDACRALLAKGTVGRMEVWSRGGAYARSRVDIAKGAKLTIRENDKRGPELVRYREFDGDALE